MRHCQLCNETGLITIWHPSTIRLAIKPDATVTPVDQMECAVPCKCPQGDKHAVWTSRQGDGRPVLRYRERWWHCLRTYRSNADGYYDPVADVKEQHVKPPNYEPSFDAFNEG